MPNYLPSLYEGPSLLFDLNGAPLTLLPDRVSDATVQIADDLRPDVVQEGFNGLTLLAQEF